MKKIIILTIAILINIILALISMSSILKYNLLNESDKQYISTIEELRQEKQAIQYEINNKNNELTIINNLIEDNTKIAEGTAKYIIKLNISQSHFTLDLSEHFKDMMNDIDIYIEVSEDYYNKYNIGDKISDDFRMGSLLFKGSFGNWQIKVADKQIV